MKHAMEFLVTYRYANSINSDKLPKLHKGLDLNTKLCTIIKKRASALADRASHPRWPPLSATVVSLVVQTLRTWEVHQHPSRSLPPSKEEGEAFPRQVHSEITKLQAWSERGHHLHCSPTPSRFRPQSTQDLSDKVHTQSGVIWLCLNLVYLKVHCS